MQARYIVFQEKTTSSQSSVREQLEEFPGEIEILRSSDRDHAVVLMDPDTELRVRHELPDLTVEEDIRHRMVAAR